MTMTDYDEKYQETMEKFARATALAGVSLNDAAERACETFIRVMAAATHLPGFKAGPDYWEFTHEEEILTRTMLFMWKMFIRILIIYGIIIIM